MQVHQKSSFLLAAAFAAALLLQGGVNSSPERQPTRPERHDSTQLTHMEKGSKRSLLQLFGAVGSFLGQYMLASQFVVAVLPLLATRMSTHGCRKTYTHVQIRYVTRNAGQMQSTASTDRKSLRSRVRCWVKETCLAAAAGASSAALRQSSPRAQRQLRSSALPEPLRRAPHLRRPLPRRLVSTRLHTQAPQRQLTARRPPLHTRAATRHPPQHLPQRTPGRHRQRTQAISSRHPLPPTRAATRV